MQLSEDQILKLAPDESSKKSGMELANPSKWNNLGANDTAVWGECQGSGSKPYQSQVDLVNLAFKCSCPSRKFPCKHSLGLLLIYARLINLFTASNPPAWVVEWLNKRTEKEEKIAEKNNKPIDEAAQVKRQLARQKKVNDGLADLLLWIKDIIRNGIIDIPAKGSAYWESMARRIIDAQAPGIAAMLRSIMEINFYVEDWQTKLLDQLLKIYLVIKGFQNIDRIDIEMQHDIRGLVGFTQNQDDLREKAGSRDDWFVLAKQVSEDDQLKVERNWLYGSNSEQYALILQFYIRNQLPDIILNPGIVIDADLVFYNSSLPMRALIKEQFNIKTPKLLEGFGSWSEVLTKEAHYNSIYPFAEIHPFVIKDLKPVSYKNEWWLQDKEKNMMPIIKQYNSIWKLLSISGGEPLTMSVLGRETAYEPVGLWFNNEYKIL